MKRFLLIITVVCIAFLSVVLFSGCPAAPVSYYITFKAGGVDKNFDKGLTNFESEPFGHPITGDPDYTSVHATPDVATGDFYPDNFIVITFYGTATGSYTGLVEADMYYLESGKAWIAANDIIVNVTRYDADEGGIIEGTFSTTLTETTPDGIILEITNGEFKVKRVAKDLYVP